MFNVARGSLLVPILFHFLSGPLWPEAQVWEQFLFALVAIAVVLLNRRTLFRREASATTVLRPARSITKWRAATGVA
jgi:hypothetical protein